MGLFSKKPKPLHIDPAVSADKKRRMREMFNGLVEDGDTYRLIYAGTSDSTFSRGLVVDTTTTTFHYLIIGYRESDFRVAVIEIDREIENHGTPCFVEIDEIESTDYYRKLHQAWLIYKKGQEGYGIKMEIGDCSAESLYGMRNIDQKEEREDFLNFLEKYTDALRAKGYKMKAWKR